MKTTNTTTKTSSFVRISAVPAGGTVTRQGVVLTADRLVHCSTDDYDFAAHRHESKK